MSTNVPHNQKAAGTGSVSISGVAGRPTLVTRVQAWFEATGPQTGTLQLKNGSTVVWEVGVSGGFFFEWDGGWDFGTAADATLVLSGANLILYGTTEETV